MRQPSSHINLERRRPLLYAGVLQHGRVATMVAFIVACLLAGCGGGKGSHRVVRTSSVRLSPTRATHSPSAPRGARVSFVYPTGGSAVAATFTARVTVSRFRLIRSGLGAKAREGFGHLHFALDHGRYDEPRYAGPNGRLALRLGVNGFYSPAYRPTITYRRIPPGWHALSVLLVNSNDTPTGVADVVRFRVR